MEKNTKIIIIALVIVLILVALGVVYVFLRGNTEKKETEEEVDKKLEIHRKYSMNFLKKALED